MAITVQVTRSVEVFPTAVFLQWSIVDTEQFGTYTVQVYRGQSPAGPWEKFSETENGYSVTDNFDTDGPADEAPNHFSLGRKLYYRVRVIPPPGPDEAVETIVEVGPNLTGRQLGMQRKMQRDEYVMLSKLNGTRVALLKRKRWGPRCPDCFDPYTREVVRGECLRCYGVGFVGGYHNPYYTYARRTPRTGGVAMTELGKVDTNTAQITLLDFPELQPDDLIVFLVENTRYLVSAASGTELKLIRIHQDVVAGELARSSIEYRIPVEDTVNPPRY